MFNFENFPYWNTPLFRSVPVCVFQQEEHCTLGGPLSVLCRAYFMLEANIKATKPSEVVKLDLVSEDKVLALLRVAL